MKALAISGIYLDIYGTGFPFHEGIRQETQIVGSSYSVSPGGSGVIFSSAFKQLGGEASLVGAIGRGDLTELLERKLATHGLTEHLVHTDEHMTNVSFNITNPKGKNILLSVGDANQHLEPEHIAQKVYDMLPTVDVLYLGSVFKLPQLHIFFTELLHKAKELQKITILDHGRLPSQVTEAARRHVKELVALADYYVPNRHEFLDFWGNESIDASLSLLQLSAKDTTVIVTKDVNGAYGVMPDGHAYSTTPHDVSVVNTIGAGDTFNAALAYAILQGKPTFEAMDFAQRCAEYKITTQHYPTVQDVA